MSLNKIVIKIGTNILFEKGRIKEENFNKIGCSLAQLKKHNIILVSSGAVGIGKKELELDTRDSDDISRNVSAAVGQNILMNTFITIFSDNDLKVAQLLLTQNDISNRETFLRVKKVIDILLKKDIIPIINENDTIKSRRNKFRDNDQLAIKIASKIEADLLIMLTNVDGVYTKDPKTCSDAELVEELRKDDFKKIEIGNKNSSVSLGGMDSKIKFAMLASQLGIRTVIANGNEAGIIEKIVEGAKKGTSFNAESRVKSKKRWILLTKVKGSVAIDDGAYKALKKGNSLLAVGITATKGDFFVNDVINIIHNGKVVAKCIVECSSDILRFIKGKCTEEIKEALSDHHCVAKHENIILINDCGDYAENWNYWHWKDGNCNIRWNTKIKIP